MKLISFFFALLVLTGLAISSPIQGQGYGSSLGISSESVLISQPNNRITPGTVYVYQKNSTGWQESSRIRSSNGFAGDGFGSTIEATEEMVAISSISSETNTVYVFEKSTSGTWDEIDQLNIEALSPTANFGKAISIDGDIMAIGAPGPVISRRSPQAAEIGAVYIFSKRNDSWVQTAQLLGRLTGDGFGSTIVIEGNSIFVGAPYEENTGVVYEFSKTSEDWEKQREFRLPNGNSNDNFGSSVVLRKNQLLVSAPGYNLGEGSVFTFTLDSATSPIAKRILPFEGFHQNGFGTSLVDSEDGLWVGSPNVEDRRGLAYIFGGDNTEEWSSVKRLMADHTRPGDVFGTALAAAKNIVVVGSTGADYRTGSVSVFEYVDQHWEQTAHLMGEVEGFTAVSGEKIECSSGKASTFECGDFDLLSFMPIGDMAPRGVTVNDVWGWTDPETKKEYALVGRRDGSAFIDISDPSHPRYLGELLRTEGSNPSTWTDIKVYKNHAFIVADGAGAHGIQIFDLTTLRGVQKPETFQATAHYDQIASAHNIVINEESGFAYSVGNSSGGQTCGGGLHILNIQEPTRPIFAGCFSDSETGRAGTGYTHDAQCVTYRGPDEEHRNKEICFNANETALSIGDVTNPADPIALSSASYPNVAYAHQGWLTEDQAYYFMNDELDELSGQPKTRTLIWDVSDLDDPQLVKEHFGTQEASDHNLYIRGNTMYQSNYQSGLRVLDISDPENPRETGFFDTVPYGDNSAGMGGSWSNYPFFESGVVIVTSGNEGLFLLRKQQPIT